jgi:uncharacterized membrane protein
MIPILAMATVLTLSQPSLAEPPSPLAPPATDQISIYEHALYKTLTYETLANGWDVLVLKPLFGVGIGSALGVTFTIANMSSAAGSYYSHEIAWDLFGVPPTDLSAMTVAAKTATYRVVSMSRSFLLAYVFFGSAPAAAAFAIGGAVADTVFFVANEYTWDFLGPRPAVP